jgi:hypothetical protein
MTIHPMSYTPAAGVPEATVELVLDQAVLAYGDWVQAVDKHPAGSYRRGILDGLVAALGALLDANTVSAYSLIADRYRQQK